ncbi:MAG: prepilin-type N-terminal cleavage/methylation domain-containing protein [Verrucomicrobia bacterium]|nr:prepilin-type N-terminal cleavage/methylation domain-containing protein [Verrucomicrobiota bacterium]
MRHGGPASRSRLLASAGAGFTLIEMLVVVGIIGILMAMLMPAISRAKGKANQIKCVNNLRQLALSLSMYADDFSGEYPPRRTPPNTWPGKLQPYFKDWQIIACPTDRRPVVVLVLVREPKRSYLINGFNDFFMKKLSKLDYLKHRNWSWPHGMKESDIPNPSQTIVFGEKRSGSFHVHMDVDQGLRGNDFEEIEQNRHGRGSNYAFADGSVRLLGKNEALYPENLWCVTDEYRYPPAPPK